VNRQIISDGAWVTLGQLASALGTLASVRILTEVLSQKQFGLFVLSTGIVYLIQGMFCTPILQAFLRLFPDFSSTKTTATLLVTAKRIVLRRTALLFVAGLAAGFAVRPYTSLSVEGLVLLNVFLACEMWRSYETNVFNAARKQREFALLTGSDAWLKPLLVLALANATADKVDGALWGFVSASATMAFLALFTRRKAEGGNRVETPDKETEQRIRRFSNPLVPLSLVSWCGGNVDRYALAVILGVGAAGTYSAAYGLVSRPFLMAGQIVEQSLRQIYYEASTKGDRSLASKTFGIWLASVGLVGLLGFLCVVWLGEWIAWLFLGVNFRDSVTVMPWIAAAYGLWGVTQAAERRFYALYLTRSVLIIEGVGLVAMACLLPVLLPAMGIRGAAVALLVGAAFKLGCTMFAWLSLRQR
jgi:O-antigen/teichoic acid export membrane protein